MTTPPLPIQPDLIERLLEPISYREPTPVNRDGPEAVAAIATLQAQLERVTEAAEFAAQCLERNHRQWKASAERTHSLEDKVRADLAQQQADEVRALAAPQGGETK